MQNVARRVNARFVRRYNGAMILATDVGGSKTLIGLFEPAAPRPRLVDATAVRTLEFGGLPELIDAYLARHRGVALDRLSLAVAGPVLHGEATLTNVPWRVRAAEVAAAVGVADVRLLNDLEAMAHAVPVLAAAELHTLQAGQPNPRETPRSSPPAPAWVKPCCTASAGACCRCPRKPDTPTSPCAPTTKPRSGASCATASAASTSSTCFRARDGAAR